MDAPSNEHNNKVLASLCFYLENFNCRVEAVAVSYLSKQNKGKNELCWVRWQSLRDFSGSNANSHQGSISHHCNLLI